MTEERPFSNFHFPPPLSSFLSPSFLIPVYPPGTIVRVRKRLLHPSDTIDGFSAEENDAISDLQVIGRAMHDGRLMYVLRHANVD